MRFSDRAASVLISSGTSTIFDLPIFSSVDSSFARLILYIFGQRELNKGIIFLSGYSIPSLVIRLISVPITMVDPGCDWETYFTI